MIALALLLMTLGGVLSRWMKVFALIPATLVAWVAAVHLAELNSFSTALTVLSAFICGAFLQFGYLMGALFLPQRSAAIRKRAIDALPH